MLFIFRAGSKLSNLMCIIALIATLHKDTDATFCSSICGQQFLCSSGLCSLTNCSTSTSCNAYCVNCWGSNTCYSTGSGCTSTVVNVFNSSNKLSTSFLTIFIIFASGTFFVNLLKSKLQ